MKMKRLAAWLLALVLVMGMAPTALAVIYDDDPYPMYVDADKAKIKMFSEMSTKSSVLTKIPNGKKVMVFSMMPGSKFANVSYNGYYGYVLISNLSDRKPAPKPTPKPEPKPTPKPAPTPKPINFDDFTPVDYYVRVDLSSPTASMNMRWQPSTDSAVVGVYQDGSYLKAIMESPTWLQVVDPTNERVGFMARKYLTKTDEPVFGAEEERQYDPELVVSPMNSVDSLEALNAAMPGLELHAVPDGYEVLGYDWINTEPLIAQILFSKDGIQYCYRAAHCESLEDYADIDGIYTPMHADYVEGEMLLMMSDDGTAAVVHYFDDELKAQYCISGPGADQGAELMKLAKAMFPLV